MDQKRAKKFCSLVPHFSENLLGKGVGGSCSLEGLVNKPRAFLNKARGLITRGRGGSHSAWKISMEKSKVTCVIHRFVALAC